jgi:hypothetical protein
MAHGNFDHLMSFKGDRLQVCGPLFWNGTSRRDLPATSLTILSLVIAQPGRTPVFATPPLVPINCQSTQPDPNEWMGFVIGDFEPGPASAVALVQLAIQGRSREWIFETWSETISVVAA